MTRRRAAVRAAELLLVAVMTVVLPATVSSVDLYLALSAPCLVAAVVLGFLDALLRR